ncbi:FAD-dependent oxidoreductase [Paenibacillus qinlingensis]|uniref:FAD dependent oxidoreductase n=1 Tax=Paenibacillus qinlingensis TaxID=1837343 RepID=A0ABU1P6N1_9BACL|nr:FAD-dependent oxidoreductase [Paenibacillus qinlingensis]MDR6555214.1 hypothetical protein [Paenibacillus qinlingensis]
MDERIKRGMLEHHEYDFIVAGGGLAGVCCAISAARGGLRTAIIQNRPAFGGNSSSEIRIVPVGSVDFNSWTMESGIIGEILLEDRATNHEKFGDGAINTLYDLNLYQAILKEPNLTAYLDTQVNGVEVDPEAEGVSSELKAIYATQLGSGKAFKFTARQFADCTGDAELGFLAGAPYRYGREARSEFGELLAPVEADNHTMGSSITFYARNAGREVPFTAPAWAHRYETAEDVGIYRDINHIKHDRLAGFWWMELANPFHQVDDFGAMKHELLRYVLGYWDFLKNRSKYQETLSTYSIDWIGMYPGKRESRRLEGDVIVSERHIYEDPCWPDRVSTSGMFVDIHINGGLLNRTEPPELSNADANYKDYTLVAPYSIPLRSLYSRSIANLWMAGRNISVSRVALGSVRNQVILANIGQAVGTAAGYAIRHQISPREAADVSQGHIQAIQQQLLRDDVPIIGLKNEDKYDLAREATATASSEQTMYLNEPDENAMVPLDSTWAQVLPITSDRIDTVEFYVSNTSEETVSLKVSVYQLERIWDKGEGVPVGTAELLIPPLHTGWICAELNLRVAAGKPHRIALESHEHIAWAKSTEQATGTLAQYYVKCEGGPQPENKHYPSFQESELVIPPYERWNEIKRKRFSFAMNVHPCPAPYGGDQVVSGIARPIAMPGLWISDRASELPQHVALKWEEERTFNEVVVTFDTSLNQSYAYMPAFWKAPECVKDWRLWVYVHDEWKCVYEEHGNYHRKRSATFDTVTASAVKLEVLATNGDASARVYEMRVYCK